MKIRRVLETEKNTWNGNEDIIIWHDRGLKYEDVAVNGEENGVKTKKLWRRQVLVENYQSRLAWPQTGLRKSTKK